jgi:hypothetical protein
MQDQDLLGAEDKAKEIAERIQVLFTKQEYKKLSIYTQIKKLVSTNLAKVKQWIDSKIGKNKSQSNEEKYKYSRKPSNMYAIYGGWGTGKTRLLEELKVLIENDYKVVWFRPWEYFEESQNIDKKLLSIFLDKNKVGKWVCLSLILFVILTIFTIGNMQWFQANIWQNFIALNWIQYLILILVISRVITLILSKFNLIQYISNLAMGGVSFNIAEIFSKLRDYTESSEEIQEKISSKIKTKTIVFVDDLDRCRKETVLEVLEHIKHFYASDKLFFVFAIDRKSLATYIAEHYNYQTEKGEIDFDRGYQYLDKLFPDSYNLRYLDGRKLFDQYLKDKNIYDELTDTDRENYYLLIEYYAPFNWRKVKALIDQFTEIYNKIQYTKVVLYEDESNVLYLDQIFRWCLVHEFYSEVFEERNWRKAIIDKFYKNNDLGCNLFQEQVFIGGDSNQYLTPITEEKNETFHLEKLYNYAGEFEHFDETVFYRTENPDETGTGWWEIKILNELEKNTKIGPKYNISLPWGENVRNGESKTEVKIKVLEFLDSLIGMKSLQMEELDFMKKDISGGGTIKIAKMKEENVR